VASKFCAVLALVLVGACGSRGSKPVAPSAPRVLDPMTFIIENSDTLAVLDVKRIIASPLLGGFDLKEELAQEEDLQEIFEAGIEPANIDKIIFSGSSISGTSLAVVSGSFDAAKAAIELNQSYEEAQQSDRAEAVGPNLLLLAGNAENLALGKLGRGLNGSPELVALLPSLDTTQSFYATYKLSPDAVRAISQGAPFPFLS
jgi:hypothetical protein